MDFIIRKTELSDVIHLPLIERSAINAFKSLPTLVWVTYHRVTSAKEYTLISSLLELGCSRAVRPNDLRFLLIS